MGLLHSFVSVPEGQIFPFLGLFAGFAASYVLLISLSKHIATILSVVFAVLLASTIAVPPVPVQTAFESGQPSDAEQSAPRPDLPPVPHLVLDGHIGIDGLPVDIEGGQELKQRIEAFYLKHGFRPFGRAFSKYMLTPPIGELP